MAATELSSVGAHDFALFYVSAETWLLGKNPYNPAMLQTTGETLFGLKEAVPSYFHFIYPPLFLPLIAPFLFFPFPLALNIYLILSASCLLLTPLALQRFAQEHHSPSLRALFILSILPPGYECLRWGGLGLLLSLVLALVLLLLKRKRFYAGGFLSTMLLIKPHLFVLVFLWLFFAGGRRLLLGLFSGLLLLGTILFLHSPDVFLWWLQGSDSLKEDLVQLQGTGLGDRFQLWLLPWSGSPISWLPFAVTLCAAIALGGLLYTRERLRDFRYFPPILALSLGVAPYGWFHDSSLLLVSLSMLLLSLRGERYLLPVLLIQLATLTWGLQFASSQSDFAWYPWLIAGMLVTSLYNSSAPARTVK